VTKLVMNFDLRHPAHLGANGRDTYRAALDMCAWADDHGFARIGLGEHHQSPDGYIPAPLVVAGAIGAVTRKVRVRISILLAPLYDPIRLAEEIAVADLCLSGRLDVGLGVGYVEHDFEMFGVDYHRRGRIADEKLSILLKAKTGEPFEHDGRRIHVTPPPLTPGGPMVAWGGGSVAAARRAGRNGIGFFAQGGGEVVQAAYEEAARAAGHEPGMCLIPDPDSAQTLFVADDLDKAWEELGPYLMHDVRSYAAWNEGNTDTASLSFAASAEELRAENKSHRIVTVAEAVAMVRAGAPLPLHPLIGGLPPEIAWRYLETVANEVMPALQG
jgi:alkanesulfonate monooxygenase SsuD/methylene tetrahydromethanopterin reductase-like flavin-dependent oxidoreductase (luciferase family)